MFIMLILFPILKRSYNILHATVFQMTINKIHMKSAHMLEHKIQHRPFAVLYQLPGLKYPEMSPRGATGSRQKLA